ncbi:hypothetical protein [Candidatus Berkiella aquae]|uniref:Uncharacterized protein n=1 Tax=Candidatus Berkiella aquae TaxID=295108 RepID=A0A0Q9YMA2_9GAMM|nr:hypothetical protein [Candidatus Berkiella aquae]MCS5710415.1 hypothetical protein [Candidatus Berkiella aquae]
MKSYALLFIASVAFPLATIACDCDSHADRYLQYNNRFGYDNRNDGFAAYRFENLQTRGFRSYYGYDREDEGIVNNRDRFGYTWDSTH